MARKVGLYRVFIASPGGLQEQRRLFHQTIQLPNGRAVDTSFNQADVGPVKAAL